MTSYHLSKSRFRCVFNDLRNILHIEKICRRILDFVLDTNFHQNNILIPGEHLCFSCNGAHRDFFYLCDFWSIYFLNRIWEFEMKSAPFRPDPLSKSADDSFFIRSYCVKGSQRHPDHNQNENQGDFPDLQLRNFNLLVTNHYFLCHYFLLLV